MGEVGVPPALESAVESLREAVTAGRTDICRRLLDACDTCDGGGTHERKQLINSHCAQDGGTFLHLATQLGHRDIVRALLSGGGDPGIVNSAGHTPPQLANKPPVIAVYTEELLRATAQSDLGRVCQLLAGGLSINSFDNAVSRNTPLHWAASFADTDTLHCLIARGADVQSLNSDGASPLHDAVARGDAEVVRALLRHGALPHAHRCTAGRHKGKTPIEMATGKGGPVLAAMQEAASDCGSPVLVRREGTGTLDMRGLAGSLESLNSIGGDSLLLSNGGPAGTIVLPSSRSTSDTTTLGNASRANGGNIAVHNSGRRSLDMGRSTQPARRHRLVSFDDSISEYPPVDASSDDNAINGHTGTNGSLPNGDIRKTSDQTNTSSAVQHYVDGSLTAQQQRNSRGSIGLSRSPIHSTSSLDFSPSMEQVYERLAGSGPLLQGITSTLVPPLPIVTSAPLHLLWPPPRHTLQVAGRPWCVPRLLTVAVVAFGGQLLHRVSDIISVHRAAIERCGSITVRVLGGVSAHTTSCSASVVIAIQPPAIAAAAPLQYRLAVTEQGVRITCGSLDSLHSALTTLTQLLRVYKSPDSSSTTDDSKSDTAGSPITGTKNHSSSSRGSGASLLRQASEPANVNPGSPAAFLRSQSEDSNTLSMTGSTASLSTAVTNASKNVADGSQTSSAISNLEIESLVITDSPDVPHRAFMLDAAPLARIPTLSTMYHIVDSMASLKLNQLHLMMRLQPGVSSNSFTENTVPNYGNLQRNNKSSCYCPLPYDVSELMALSRYCKDRGMVLVPAFDLDQSWNGGRPASLSILEVTAAVANTLKHFCDAVFVSIGPGLTSVLSLNGFSDYSSMNPWEYLGLPDNATLIVCANVLKGHSNPSQSMQQPNVPYGALLMEYGFQADHEFGPAREAAVNEGRSHAVCTGTAAWSSLAGFPEASARNVYEGVVDKRHLASSVRYSSTSVVVVAHWSTPASLTPLVFMWPSVVVGAGLAWNGRTHFDYVNSSIGLLIDTHLVGVDDCGFGKAMVELGRCETWLTREMRNQENGDVTNLPPASTGPGSTLHQLLADPDSVVLEHLSSEKFGSVLRHVKRSIRNIANNRVVHSEWPLMPVAAAELNLSADLMMTACRLGRALVTVGSNPHSNLGMAVVNPGLTHLPPTLRTDVANRLLSLRESYSCLWLHCHQPAGLQASLLLLSSLLTRLLPQHDNIQNL